MTSAVIPDTTKVLVLFFIRSHSAPPMDTELPDIPRKGRGAVSNQTGRFEGYDAVAIDDGWNLPRDADLPPLRTTVTADTTRTIIRQYLRFL